MSSRVTRSLDAFDSDQQQAGMVAAPSFATVSTLTPTATPNRLWASRFSPSRAMAVTKLAVVTTVAATNDDPCAVAIYDSTATRVATSGAVSGKMNAAAGVQEISLTATYVLSPGQVYYAAFSYGTVGGTAATLITVNYSSALVNGIFGTSPPQREAGVQDTAHVPPVGPLSLVSGANVILLAVRES